MSEDLVTLAHRWPERAATHYEGCEADHVGCLVKKLGREVERLRAERDEAWAEVERLTAERDAAQAEVQRLITERDQTANRPKGREMMRVGLGDAYVNPIPPPRPSDEDIWRETLMTLLPSYPWEKAAAQADCVLAEYRKRWPR